MSGSPSRTDQKFVSVTGHASVSRDKAKIKELWGPSAKAWWDSPDDPNIRLLTVTPDDAEFWEGPGKIVGTIKMAAAAATNSRPELWRKPQGDDVTKPPSR